DDQRGPFPPGGFEQLHVAGVQQVENAVGKDYGARLPGSPGQGLRQAHHFRPAVDHAAVSEGRAPKSSFRPGGATKVVAITMSRMAPNTASFKMPARRPMSAKINPTSPRGIIPTPTTTRRNCAQGAAHPAATLPATASRVSTTATPSSPEAPSRLGSSSRTLTEAPTLTKKMGVRIEPTGRTSRSIVSNWL